MKSGLKVRADRSQVVFSALNEIARRDVLVGIPEAISDRQPEEGEKSGIGNAQIGYINEYGSPAQNIPPRPHLQPGVKSVHAETSAKMKAAAQAVFDGRAGAATAALESAGTIASQAVKSYMTSADFTPLSPATLKARARRGRKGAAKELQSRAAGNAPDNANARPLIDEGQYRRAMTYIVRDKNANS